MVLCQRLKPFGEVFTWAKHAHYNSLQQSGFTRCHSRFAVQKFLCHNSVLTNKTPLLQCSKDFYVVFCNCFHSSNQTNGRYGHRLIKLWEQKEYTTKPLKVYRTGGRLPVENWKGDIVPGRVWTAKLGGGLPRKFHWVERTRLTAEEVQNEVMFQEKVIKIIEDDNRSGHIALVTGPWKRRWVMATTDMKVGDLITNSARTEVGGNILKDGDAYPLKLIPIGTKVCFVEFRPGKGGQIARSAGTYCTLIRKTDTRAILQMPSKREIHVELDCVAVLGQISNVGHQDVVWGSAQQRWEYGLRPSTGRHHKKDGRFAHRNLPALPPVIVTKAESRTALQKDTEFED